MASTSTRSPRLLENGSVRVLEGTAGMRLEESTGTEWLVKTDPFAATVITTTDPFASTAKLKGN
jgi:hypothetical protein